MTLIHNEIVLLVFRTTASTKLNEHSSRSHSILILKLTKRMESPARTQSSKLFIIDLAGSENNKHTGNRGIRYVIFP